MSLQRILYIPDAHVPYEDDRAFNLMCRVAKNIGVDVVVILGDFMDCYAISDHDKNPNRVRLLDEEIAHGNERLTQLDKLKAKKKYYIKGNHENRLERYLMRKAPELYNMVQMKDLLKLGDRGWHVVEYRDHDRIGKVYATHETGTAGQNAHRQSVNAFGSNVVIGHTHRMEFSVVGSLTGVPHVGAMFGWLGDFSKVDYMHRVKAKRDWVHGFGIGYMQPNGVVHIHPVPIVNWAVVVEGKLYEG